MTHYPTEGAAYAAARDRNERQMLKECEHGLRDAVESWYYSQKHLSNIVENNRKLREAWEVFQYQVHIVERLDQAHERAEKTEGEK